MARLTLAQAKASRIPNVLGMCASDEAFVQILNEATQRLLSKGKWVGTYGRYRVCATDGCITWPRQFETVESVAVCDKPIPVRNQWFEFLEQSAGLQGGSNCNGSAGQQLMDRGNYCTFADILGSGKKLRVYADVAEADGAQILLLGYDDNGNWIRTIQDGVWADGELVTISTTPTNSINYFSSLTSVQKPVTNGNVRLYEYNVEASTQRALAVYEPDETLPWYRRSYIGEICSGGCGSDLSDDETCTTKTVTVMAKLAFIPVSNDTDYLLIGNLPALKEMCRAIRFGEMDSPIAAQQSAVCEGKAIAELQNELNSWLGDGVKMTIEVQNSSGFGEPVQNLI